MKTQQLIKIKESDLELIVSDQRHGKINSSHVRYI